ncbi:MAG: hypothetical protein LUI87_11145 [Lachnospiraceae bacterium]|nr:hypothetical protein [Lachnospiraceae bacterium]
MPERQRGWNIYEAVILLEGLLEILNDGVPRKDIIRRVSRDLREMARQQGEDIDEIFRNENGISFQLQSMESAYKGYTISKPATKLFLAAVEMYQQNRPEYDKLLGEARAMINNTQSCESDFMTWLSSKVSPAQLSELYWCYTEIESSCLSVKILKKPLFETTDYETVQAVQRYIEQNKFFHAMHRRQFSKLITAGRHYLAYTKEMATKQLDNEKNVSEPVDKHEETKTVEKPVALVSVNKTDVKDTKIDEKRFSTLGQETLESQLKKELEAESARNRFGTTLVFLMRQVKCTDERKVKQILEQAPWARLQYGRYYYAEEPQQETPVVKRKTDNSEKSEVEQKKAETPLVRTSEDERLLAKYPIIYKRVFFAVKESSIRENGVSIGEIQELTQRIGRASDIEEILDNASWSKSVDGGYHFSDEIIIHDDEMQEENEDSVEETKEQNEWTIDFDNLGSFAHTKPSFFTYFEENKGSCSSWTELYVSFFAALYEDYPHLFKPGMSFSVNRGRVELAVRSEAGFMAAPKDVPGTNYAIETNISATDIVRKMKYLLDFCSVDYENVVIKYCRRTPAGEAPDTVIVHPIQGEQKAAMIDRLSFYHYLIKKQNLSVATSRSYSSAIGSCETFAREHHYESWRLYTSDLTEAKATVDALFRDADFIEYNDRWHNQLRAAIAKLLVFIGDGTENIEIDVIAPRTASPTPARDFSYRNEPYEEVLKEKFRRGFRLDSAIELRRFRKFYADMHGMDVKEDDNEIISIIRRLCILCDDRAYHPDVMLSPELKTKLLDYIEKCFDDGKTTIYYQALCTEFAEEFIDYPLHNNPDALKVYLSDVGYGKFYINRTCISKEANVTTDPLTEIRECLKEFGRPVKFEELFAALPHLPQSKIKFLLAANAEFVSNGQGTYFHESTVRLSDEEFENIASIIEQTIEEKDFIGGNELYDEIKVMYPYIIEENSELSVYGFRDALKYKFGDRFSFKGNIISAAGKELAMADVFANYARKHESFTLTELETLAHELASTIYFDSVYENSLRISQEQFVSKYRAQFNVPEVDAAMDRICSGDYMAIKQVNNFAVFPYVGFPWNSFLLEHYVAAYSKKYTLLHSGFNRAECAGAIVKRSANINSFDDFIVEFLKNTDVELKKTPVLQMLVQEGYLVRRRYANIEDLIIRAKAQRNRKETD